MKTSTPDLGAQLAALHAISGKMATRDGDELRACIQQISELAGAAANPDSCDAALQARVATELDHLVAAIGRLAGLQSSGAGSLNGIDIGPVIAQLQAFVAYLRTPMAETRAALQQLIPKVDGDAPRSPRDAWIESLAMDAARACSLSGASLDDAVARARRALALPVRQLELDVQRDAARAATAAKLDPLLDAVIASGSALGPALAEQRADIAHAFRRVDLAHMANGLHVISAWLAAPAGGDTTDALVARLRAQLAEALGPPILEEPAISEATRRTRFEREVAAAVERAIHGDT